jgi:type IV pilus assembly protein PilE
LAGTVGKLIKILFRAELEARTPLPLAATEEDLVRGQRALERDETEPSEQVISTSEGIPNQSNRYETPTAQQELIVNKPIRLSGFNLIELMIAVAVVGILGAIAYPSYVDSVRKSRRSDAQASLMEAAQKLEAHRARHATYTLTLADAKISATSPEGYYTIAVAGCPISSCYTLTATPTGTQAEDRVKGFRLDSTGKKELSQDGSEWTDGWVAH